MRDFLSANLWPRMAPHQMNIVVPGLFADVDTGRSGSLAIQDERMEAKLRAYEQWIKEEPRIVGMNAWHWNDFNGSIHPMPAAYADGTYSLPKTAKLLADLANERPRKP